MVIAHPTSAPDPQASQELFVAGWHLRLLDSLSLGAFVALVYDHMLTFSDEVEYIWKRRVSPVSVLFLINRYFCPAAFIICMVSLFSPTWTVELCSRFSKFQAVLTEVTVLVAELILILRVYAVHNQNKIVLVGISLIWVVQLCTMSWIVQHTGPVVFPRTSVTYGCIDVADADIGYLEIIFIIPSLAFDLTTFLLLVWGILKSKDAVKLPIGQTILRDGTLYFVGLFVLNVAWTATGILMPTSLKSVLLFVSAAVTNILIGRLTLNLKIRVVHIHTADPVVTTCWLWKELPPMEFSTPNCDTNAVQNATASNEACFSSHDVCFEVREDVEMSITQQHG